VPAVAFRCPYCHASVEPASEPAVLCAACLARHHGECWEEHAGCGACGEAVPLRPSAAARAFSGALLVGAGVALGLLLGYSSPREAGGGREGGRSSLRGGGSRLVESALACRAKGNLEGALAELDRAVLLDPRSEYAHRCRGLVLSESGDSVRAREELTRAVELDPRSAFAWALRGACRLERGDARGAISDLDRALALSPGFAWARALRERASTAPQGFMSSSRTGE